MTAKPALLAVIFLYLAGGASAQQPDQAGALLQQCKICHSFDQNGHATVGPNLHGIFGRKAGTMPDASAAMRSSGIVWDDASLAKFLRDPQGSLPGNRMSFPGVTDSAVLSGLIARLKQATQ